MAIWYGLWSFGTVFSFWYVWTKKNLATLIMDEGKNRNQIFERGNVFVIKQTETIQTDFSVQMLHIRVARWFIFIPKTQFGYFGGPWNVKWWYV
jgi:hypothetical protein